MSEIRIKELARSIDPSHGLTTLVTEYYEDITAARTGLWSWAKIAEALGLGADRDNAVRLAYYRVDKKVKAGKIVPRKGGTEKPAGISKGHAGDSTGKVNKTLDF